MNNLKFEVELLHNSIMLYDNIFSLENLSTEVLLIIFSYLSITELKNLRKVCSRFNKIISHHWDLILFNRREKYLVTNQCSQYIQERSQRFLTPFEKHRISNNWKVGRYKESKVFLSKEFIPHFHLEQNSIWFGKDDSIKCYQRSKKKIFSNKLKHDFCGFNYKDVCKFVVKNDKVCTANGHVVKLFSLEKGECTSNISFNDIRLTSIDMEMNSVAVGSKEGVVQLLNVSDELDLVPCKILKYEDLVWCLAFNKDKLSIGTAANICRTCIIVTDTESGQTLHEFVGDNNGAGILQMKWDNPDVLWSGGYDCYLRRWDLRIGQCVQKFLDPWSSKINCFDYDFVNTLITGCDNSRATLWDIRKDRYVQVYFMESARLSWTTSPIHSIAFDAEHLFAATDLYLNMLDFSVMNGGFQDYSKIFFKQLVI
ncbi:F-box/WD repeat-containing protein 4 [Coccinella septempunctata]|uniref:F-box/WD repeat-containing protein 4 n=1 Tax=Coccinella septempunctata TaxID=41139 RepID=UPI001D081972|nr:F-box/WD repeat-containing protein 4 [Coccinella septempunctata]